MTGLTTLRYVLSTLAGMAMGYVCFQIASNLEDWPFRSLRMRLTGCYSGFDVMDHPADRWIVLGIFLAFVVPGAVAGVLLARYKVWSKVFGRIVQIERND